MNHLAQQQTLTFLDSWLAYRGRHIDFPGFSVAVLASNDLIFSRAYGLADLETKMPLTPSHVFAASSQSKMVTATAIMQLAAQNKLHLDDSLHRHLPWFAAHPDPRAKEITIRQLLSHSSGLVREGEHADYWQLTAKFPDAAALRRLILSSRIAVDPNTKLKYSNLGFALLGQVIEAASGKSYHAFVTEHIINPLHLTNTTTDYSPQIAPQLARSYSQPFEHRRLQVAHDSVDTFASVVGIHATPTDLCRFAQAHFPGNTALLTDAHKKELQRSQWTITSGYDSGYEVGLGFEIRTVQSRRLVGHTGHVHGYMSATFFDPHTKLAVSVMANAHDGPASQIVNGIFGAFEFFETHATRPTPPALDRFNVRLCRLFSTVEIVTTPTRIVAIDPDAWEPFAWPDELHQINATSLRLTTPGNVFSEDEIVRYHFKANAVTSVNYIGVTMLPEAQYRANLRSSN